MPIYSPTGYLDITNAILRTSNIDTQGITAQTIQIGDIEIIPTYGLEHTANVGNTVSNVIQFTNETTSLVTSGNVAVGRDLTVTGNVTVSDDLTVTENLFVSNNLTVTKDVTVTGNTFYTNPMSISVDSNVVAEYTGPHDRPLRKYPEVAMTAATTGGYTATASSHINNDEAYTAFDGSTNTTWHSQFPYYTANGGVYESGNEAGATGTPSGTLPSHELVSGYAGEYITLSLPKQIKMVKISINTRVDLGLNLDQTQSAEVIVVVGSHDGSTWEYVDTHTVGAYPQDNTIPYIFNVNTSTYYKHVGLICTNTGPIDSALNSAWSMSELAFYGHEEGDSSLDTTLKSVYNVPGTQQLEVYYDAKNYTSGVVPDLSTNSLNGTLTNGATFDNSDGIGKFTFDGSNDYISGSIPSTFTGNQTYTFSTWIKPTSHPSSGFIGIFEAGTRSTDDAFGLYLNAGNIVHLVYGTNLATTTLAPVGQWTHITGTYTSGDRKVYANGVLLGQDTYSALTLAGTTLVVGANSGGTQPFTGSIANFRLFSKALNAGQVQELYDYQKDYFLGTRSSVTLYKGHLGIGVAEPSGQLELAGDERIQEYPPGPMSGYETLIPGHGVFCVYAGDSEAYSYQGTPHSFEAWRVFDDTSVVYHGGNRYTTAGTDSYGAYEAFTPGTIRLAPETPLGDYIVLKMPYKIKAHSVVLADGGARMPRDFIIYGSNDGLTWSSLKSITGATANGTHLINSTEYFSQLAMVITKKQDGDGYINIPTIRYFGTPGPTTLDKGSLTLGRSLDVPRISRYDVDTETPRPEKLVVDFDTTVNSSPTDISGKGNHGAFYGTNMNYSSADKAFVFNGTDDYIDAALPPEFDGDPTLTISIWVNPDSLGGGTGWNTSIHLGENSGDDQIQLTYNAGAGYLMIGGYGQSMQTNDASALPVGQWTHLCAVITPGAWSATTKKLYINGEFYPTTLFGSGTTSIPAPSTTSRLVVGAVKSTGSGYTHYLDGKISNPKLYSVALEASEVRKLYNLGRTGRSMVISDTAVGIGKVPEAQLDVRGNAIIRGLTHTEKLIYGFIGHKLVDEAELYYDPTRAECQDGASFASGSSINDIKGNYPGTLGNMARHNYFWSANDNTGFIKTTNTIELRRDWTIMMWYGPVAADNLSLWTLLGHGQIAGSAGLHVTGADADRIRYGFYGNDIDAGTLTGMSRKKEWSCLTMSYYHNGNVAGGVDRKMYQNERLVAHQQGSIGDGGLFSTNAQGSAGAGGHQPYAGTPTSLRFGASYNTGDNARQYQQIGPCLMIPRFLSDSEVRSLYRHFARDFPGQINVG